MYRKIVLTLVIFLFIISTPLSTLSGPNDHITNREDVMEPTRSLFNEDPLPHEGAVNLIGRTMFLDDLSDDLGIEDLEGVVYDQGAVMNDMDEPSRIAELPSSNMVPFSFIPNSRSVVQAGGEIFIIYSERTGINIDLVLVNSSNGGLNWSDPLIIWKDKVDGVKATMCAWQGSLHIAFSPVTIGTPNKNGLYVRSAPIGDISRMETGTDIEIRKGFVSEFELTYDEDSLYLVHTRSNDGSCWISVFDEGLWDSGTSLVSNTFCTGFSTCCVPANPDHGAHVFYTSVNETTPENDLDLNVIITSESGEILVGSLGLGTIPGDDSTISAAAFDGAAVVLCYGAGIEGIEFRHCGSPYTTWDQGTIGSTSVGSLTTHFTNERLLTTYSGMERGVTYLSLGRNLSEWSDDLRTWNIEEGAVDQLTSTFDGGLVGYFEEDISGGRISIVSVGYYNTSGTLTTRELSPPLLRSWEDIGVDVDLPENTSILMRIIDHHNGRVLYPREDWIDVRSRAGSSIHGINFDHVVKLYGLWNGSRAAPSISLQFRLAGEVDRSPVLRSIAVNYSTGFPYSNDLTCLDHIEECTSQWSTGYMNISGGEVYEYFILEPMERGAEPWPDHIGLTMEGIGEGDNVYIGLRDPVTGKAIPGYTVKECQMRNGLKEEGLYVPIWNGSSFGEINDSIEAVIIEVSMHSVYGSGSISVQHIRTLNDLEPGMINFSVLPGRNIRRGETLTISGSFYDDLQPQTDLEIMLMSEGKDGSPPLMFSGPSSLDDRLIWETDIEPGTSTGKYDLYFIINDMVRRNIENNVSIGAVNIRKEVPGAPPFHINKDEPTTIEDLMVNISSDWLEDHESPSDLRFTYVWKMEGNEFTRTHNTTSVNSTISYEQTAKGQSWVVEVACFDGQEWSPFDQMGLTIANSGPIWKHDPLQRIELMEDQVSDLIDIRGLFTDPDGDELDIGIRTGNHIKILGSRNMIRFRSDDDWFGSSWIDLSVSDGTDLKNFNITLIVSPVNDLPEHVRIIAPMNRTNVPAGYMWNLTGTFVDIDIAWGQNVTCHWDVDGKIIGTGKELRGVILDPGIHNISFVVSDNLSDPILDRIVVIVKEQFNPNVHDEETEGDDDGEQNIITPMFIITLLITIFLIVTVVILIRREVGLSVFKKKYKPAPVLEDDILHRSEPFDPGSAGDGEKIPLLPPKEPETSSMKDRMARFKGIIQRTRGRVVLDQKGERIERPASRFMNSYSPYSSYSMSNNRGSERISEYNSFYIRPEDPYRRLR